MAALADGHVHRLSISRDIIRKSSSSSSLFVYLTHRKWSASLLCSAAFGPDGTRPFSLAPFPSLSPSLSLSLSPPSVAIRTAFSYRHPVHRSAASSPPYHVFGPSFPSSSRHDPVYQPLADPTVPRLALHGLGRRQQPHSHGSLQLFSGMWSVLLRSLQCPG